MRCGGWRPKRRRARTAIPARQQSRSDAQGARRRGRGRSCILQPVQTALLFQLRERRDRIRRQWEALLRVEPVATPLGHPDALVHLIDWSLDEIFAALANPLPPQLDEETDCGQPVCPCGRNPLLAYFGAGQRALQEGLILAQAASAPLDPEERDRSMRRLVQVVRRLARRETEAFCGVCQSRQAAQAETEAYDHSLSGVD